MSDSQLTERHVMAALRDVNRALGAALEARVPGTITIGPEDPSLDDDGCVHLGLLVPEGDLTSEQAARFGEARAAAEALNDIIRRMDAAGQSVMLAIQPSPAEPLALLGTAWRPLFAEGREDAEQFDDLEAEPLDE